MTTITPKIIAQIKKYRQFIWLALILLSAIFVYKDCLQAGLVNWDDGGQVTNNRDIQELSPAGIIKIFRSFYLGMYQPLVTGGYALEYHLVQAQPWLYHLDNLLLHLLNIVLVWLLTKQLFKKDSPALLSSAIFAVHPLVLESVAWVSARSTLLFAGFYLLAMLFYLKYLKQGQLRYYWLVILSFTLSLLAKPLAVTLPVVLCLLDYYRQRPLNKKLFLDKIPLFALSIIFGLVATRSRETYFIANQDSYIYSWPNKIAVWLYSLGDYIEKLILPNHLSTFYAFPEQIQGWLPWHIYAVAVGFLALSGLLIKFRSNKTLIFLGLFYLANLALTVQIKLFSRTVIADRYAYLAGLAVIWLMALAYAKIIAAKPQYKIIINVIVIIYCLMLGAITMNRLPVWQNNLIFWQRAVDEYPNDSFALSALGGAYYELKLLDQALIYSEKSIKIHNRNSDALSKLGTIYFDKQDYRRAIDYYNRAITINNGKSIYYYNRACAIAGLGDQRGALIDYELALKFSQSSDQYLDDYYLALANTKYKLGDYAGAVTAYDTAIALVKDPAEAYFFRGLSKLNLQNKTEGCQDIAQAGKLEYKDAQRDYNKLCQ